MQKTENQDTPAQFFQKQTTNSILDVAAQFFMKNLAGAAAEYVSLRGADAETWGLGYAPSSWDALSSHLKAAGFTDDQLVESGLAFISEKTGKPIDRFRDRLMFPISDHNGIVVGFGGRDMSGKHDAKYINSPETEAFKKSRLLYGFDKALPYIRRTGEVIITEGYFDVISAATAEHPNTVGQMGTALSADQVGLLLSTGCTSIVFALDNDEAGLKSTMRGLELIRQGLAQSAPHGAYFRTLVFRFIGVKDLDSFFNDDRGGDMQTQTVEEFVADRVYLATPKPKELTLDQKIEKLTAARRLLHFFAFDGGLATFLRLAAHLDISTSAALDLYANTD